MQNSNVLSRRSLLRGFAAIAPLAAIAAPTSLAFVPSADAATTAENPQLVALGEQITPLLDAYRAAAEKKRAARAMAENLCPSLPDELVRKRTDRISFAGCSAQETDVEGKTVWPPDYVGADGKTYAVATREILEAGRLREAIAQSNIFVDRRTKSGKQLVKLIETAERYEAEREAAIERSGVREAAHELRCAAFEIEMLAYKVREIEPRAIIGVVIQARMLMAHSEAELDGGGFVGRSGTVLGRELAAAVLKHGTPGVKGGKRLAL